MLRPMMEDMKLRTGVMRWPRGSGRGISIGPSLLSKKKGAASPPEDDFIIYVGLAVVDNRMTPFLHNCKGAFFSALWSWEHKIESHHVGWA